MNTVNGALLTGLYQLNMIQAYLDHGRCDTAVFEFFVRRLPPQRGFLLAAGLEQCLDFLENLWFPPEEIAWLGGRGARASGETEHRAHRGLQHRLIL